MRWGGLGQGGWEKEPEGQGQGRAGLGSVLPWAPHWPVASRDLRGVGPLGAVEVEVGELCPAPSPPGNPRPSLA